MLRGMNNWHLSLHEAAVARYNLQNMQRACHSHLSLNPSVLGDDPVRAEKHQRVDDPRGLQI